VNAVAPAIIETDMLNFVKTEAGRSFAVGIQALKRIARPKDIAGASPSSDARHTGGPNASRTIASGAPSRAASGGVRAFFI
jgi:NAD(P)-dependent dehydrogenase (short-subunit alcohol dehydrogenase family)